MATTLPLPLLEVESNSSETFPVENPATGETLAHLPRMGAEETQSAIERASAALPAWRARLAEGRARHLPRRGGARKGSRPHSPPLVRCNAGARERALGAPDAGAGQADRRVARGGALRSL